MQTTKLRGSSRVLYSLLFYLAVTLKNVSELLEFSLLYNADQLRDVCTEYICNNLGSLMEARFVKSQIYPNTVRVKIREHVDLILTSIVY